MQITNNTNLPTPLLRALVADDYDDGGADITATGLLLPPHLAALERREAARLPKELPSSAILIGKAVHAYIAQHATGEFDDRRRLFMRTGGWVVSGQTDHVFPMGDEAEALTSSGHQITDFKTVSTWEWRRGLRADREQQLNIYAELLRTNGFKVSALSACLIFRDWSPRSARYERDYPPEDKIDVPVPLWPQADAQAYILERVRLHQEARASPDAVVCSDEERWRRVGAWAVMKPGRKPAVKRCATLLEAETLALTIPGATIEPREQEYTRCEYWCRVGRAGLCPQWERDRAVAWTFGLDAKHYAPGVEA